MGMTMPVLLLTHVSNESIAIKALRAGVNDYLKWPLSEDKIYQSISRLSRFKDTHVSPLAHNSDESEIKIIGDNNEMIKIRRYLMRVAATESTVLITGETGTGKDLTAQMIHRYSLRPKGPFVAVNCAALPENLVESELFGHRKGAFTGAHAVRKGRFELASGGTLFLDEIGDMDKGTQAKILRTIENNAVDPLGSQKSVSVDFRTIAATNRDPEELMKEGRFREDLFYRLNVARIHLPPLRERKDDIPKFVANSVEKLNKRYHRKIDGLSCEAMSSLYQHNWPGNIRELSNMIESAFINCESKKIEFTDLPPSFTKKLTYAEESSIDERDRLLMTLAATNWNKSQAAKKLNWSRMRVYRALSRYKLATPD
jgi:DNA-binding NtrC family response regulator